MWSRGSLQNHCPGALEPSALDPHQPAPRAEGGCTCILAEVGEAHGRPDVFSSIFLVDLAQVVHQLFFLLSFPKDIGHLLLGGS